MNEPKHRKEVIPEEPSGNSLGNQLRRIAYDIESHVAVSPREIEDIALKVDRLENPNG